MPKRRRHASPNSAHAETEVWPAYVDVMSAAFVFVLLAFAALLTRDVQEEESRTKEVAEDAAKNAKFVNDFDSWQRAGQQAVNEAAVQMANELTPVGLVSSCVLPDMAQVAANPSMAATFSEKLYDLDPEHRHPVAVVCTFSSISLGFKEGEVRPEETDRALVVPVLVALSNRIVAHHCGTPDVAGTWCSAGLEVVGHTDCKPVTKTGTTNWELGSGRASWVLRQMIDGTPAIASLRQGYFRVGAVGRADREPRPQASRVRRQPGLLDMFVPEAPPCDQQEGDGDLAQNRRVELLVYLRTRPLPAPPQQPKRARK